MDKKMTIYEDALNRYRAKMAMDIYEPYRKDSRLADALMKDCIKEAETSAACHYNHDKVRADAVKTTFIIHGKLPSLNDYIDAINSHRQVGAKMKTATDAFIFFEIKSQIMKYRTDKMVDVNFLWVEPNKKRDKDNVASGKKFILDALQMAGTIGKDGWKNIRNLSDEFEIDPVNPCVVVTLTEVL